ncbi:MAG: glycosyltransferase family 39 protein [bacterium]|nr:glycosyltransferase family 39 protein [bacterium]
MSRESKTFILLFVLVLIIGAAIRVWGIAWGLPQEFHPDEPLLVPRAIGTVTTGDWNPHYFLVPSLQTEVTSVVFNLVYFGGRISGTFRNASDFGEWSAWHYGTLYLIGRSISLIFGLLVIAGTMLLTMEVLTKHKYEERFSPISTWVSIFSGCMVAISPLIVTASRFIAPDIPMLAFYVWAVYLMLRAVNTGRSRTLALAGFVAGLAISSKYSAAVLIIPIYISAWQIGRTESKSNIWQLYFVPTFTLFCGFLIGTPWAILDSSTFLEHLFIQYRQQHEGHLGMEQFGLTGLNMLRDFVTNEGFGFLIMALVGIFAAFKHRRREWWIIASLLIVYLGEVSRWQVYADRYLLPAIPLLAVMAGFGLNYILGLSRNRKLRNTVAVAIAILVLVPPSIVSITNAQRLFLPDTRTLALEWVEKNIPAESSILLEIGGPQPADSNAEFHREPSYDVVILPPSFSNISRATDPGIILAGVNPEYIITSSNYRSRYESELAKERYPEIAEAWRQYYAMLDLFAEIVYQAEPYTDDSSEVVGPEIVIYRNKAIQAN